jgi:chromosome segregation ATPase
MVIEEHPLRMRTSVGRPRRAATPSAKLQLESVRNNTAQVQSDTERLSRRWHSLIQQLDDTLLQNKQARHEAARYQEASRIYQQTLYSSAKAIERLTSEEKVLASNCDAVERVISGLSTECEMIQATLDQIEAEQEKTVLQTSSLIREVKDATPDAAEHLNRLEQKIRELRLENDSLRLRIVFYNKLSAPNVVADT